MLGFQRCRSSKPEIGGQPMLVVTKNLTRDAYVWLTSTTIHLTLVGCLTILFNSSIDGRRNITAASRTQFAVNHGLKLT